MEVRVLDEACWVLMPVPTVLIEVGMETKAHVSYFQTMGSEENGDNILSSSADAFRFLPLLFWLNVLAFPPGTSLCSANPVPRSGHRNWPSLSVG